MLRAAWDSMTVRDGLEETSPGSRSPYVVYCRGGRLTTQDGDHGECWVLLPGAGAAGGLTCRRCAVVEALSDQVQELCEEMSRLNSIGKDEEVTAGSPQ